MSKQATIPGVGLSASMEPRLVTGKRRQFKTYQVRVPGLGRIGFTNDPGEADIFRDSVFSTRLGAIVKSPDGRVIDELDFGSGVVTNVGVTALANDSSWTAETTEPVNTLSVLQWHMWGKGTGAAEAFNYKLETPVKTKKEKSTNKAEKVTSNVLKFIATGNAKWISTSTLEAEETVAITEWGIFTAQELKQAEVTAGTGGEITTTKLKITTTPWEASGAKKRGLQNQILWVKENEGSTEAYGLVLSNTTGEVTVPGWVSAGAATLSTNPKASTKVAVQPVMWDRRKFEPINVESGNKIEFPYELEIKSNS